MGWKNSHLGRLSMPCEASLLDWDGSHPFPVGTLAGGRSLQGHRTCALVHGNITEDEDKAMSNMYALGCIMKCYRMHGIRMVKAKKGGTHQDQNT